ncbi:amidohydrolase family protein [Massilia psychrophila]|nr:amidohydrolase family protein [Massilia psychrophila]GGE82259.1 hypothetical protein GCM10008020_28960 [Massilia psychrophila]
MAAVNDTIPVEVELALDVMPCQAMRRTYDSAAKPHPCSHFAEWGVFHSYDYQADGPPAVPGVVQPSAYVGKRPVVPEILSGCRKAPILAVGINPNLPGWSTGTRNSIHPYFDDYLQYAHYFRWRALDKLRIPAQRYRELKGTRDDDPFTTLPLTPEGSQIDVELAPVTMYAGYQSLLDGLAERMGWEHHKLMVGEDLAYANMVACGSARWTTRPVAGMPVMGEERGRAIVHECFHKRRYFLRQLLQSLPGVLLVFSQTTADAFITAMSGKFTRGDPAPREPLADLLQREIRLQFGHTDDGELLDARVIFSPHVSARPDEFEAARQRIIDQLVAEVTSGGLTFNPTTGHLARKRGACVFCRNDLYSIGPCDYRAELRPVATERGPSPLEDAPRADALAERAAQFKLLEAFMNTSPAPRIDLLDDAAASSPPLVLLGDVVTMNGPPLAQGAVYLRGGKIIAVQAADVVAPAGFDDAPRIATDGVIYPGLADLHNHLVYNVLPLWWPKQARMNRSQWLRDPEYKRLVSLPMEVLAKRQDLLRAVVRYVEVKLLLGGVTSGQGMVSKYRGGKNFVGLVRNFEQPTDLDLPAIRHKITDLSNRDLETFRTTLETGSQFFFHLAEGTDARARDQFALLDANGLLARNLVGVHSLGLKSEDLRKLADHDAAMVWSPFSNSILYGQTVAPDVLLESNIRFGLGSDWTPSGSRNLLQEMKIASLTAEAKGVALSAERLARAATVDAAHIAGWGERLGRLRTGYDADLLVLVKEMADPYENLIAATEREVRMVVIAGHPRHGDLELMRASRIAEHDLETITVGGRTKALFLRHPSSSLNYLRFSAAQDTLRKAMSDLPAARNAVVFDPLDDQDWLEVELEMQTPGPEPGEIDVLADVVLPTSVKLDPPTVIDDPAYWETLDQIAHLPAYLKGPNGLKRFY